VTFHQLEEDKQSDKYGKSNQEYKWYKCFCEEYTFLIAVSIKPWTIFNSGISMQDSVGIFNTSNASIWRTRTSKTGTFTSSADVIGIFVKPVWTFADSSVQM
jgi:hypothetical protein